MEAIKRHTSYANVAATLALVFAMSGGAIAATGGFTSNGKLQACVGESGGLTLLKSGKHCKKGQKTVAWNETGPAGPSGPRGVAGAPGAPGAPGAAGAKGTEGIAGQSALTNIVVRTKHASLSGLVASGVQCEPGQIAISGGAAYSDNGASSTEQTVSSAPLTEEGNVAQEGDEATGWATTMYTPPTANAKQVTFYAVCAS